MTISGREQIMTAHFSPFLKELEAQTEAAGIEFNVS